MPSSINPRKPVRIKGRKENAVLRPASIIPGPAATGGGISSRLFQEIRERRGLAYSIYTFHWTYSNFGLLGFYAGLAA